MSQTNLNYMNGVPVKISEKYKPPIKIEINQKISQRLANANNDIIQQLAANYDFSLEKSVLLKLSEWQQRRQQENCDKKERIRIRQQEQQRHIEQKQKQMLTAVSYPSTDDLSSDDERESSNDSATMKTSGIESESTTISVRSTPGHFSPQNCFDNILVPTVIPEQLTNKRSSNILAPKFNKINYSDFENDTSSPFDNVELKTINDLDILAQVLNISTNISDDVKTAVKTNQVGQNDLVEQKQSNVATNDAPSQINTSNYLNIYHSQQQNFPVHYQMTNNYYGQSGFINSNRPQMNQNSYSYVSQPYSNQQQTLGSKNILYQTAEFSHKSSKNEYFHRNGFNRGETHSSNQMYLNNFVNTSNYSQGSANKSTFHTEDTEIPNKSKSKSVPDIVQELDNELKNSERKRTRNNSQCSTNTANGKLNLLVDMY